MYLSVLSLSLIFATVLGFSLSLVSALSLISLLPCLPPNSPTPPPLLSCILTILTLQDYLNPMFSVTLYSYFSPAHPRHTLSNWTLAPADPKRRWVVRSVSRWVGRWVTMRLRHQLRPPPLIHQQHLCLRSKPHPLPAPIGLTPAAPALTPLPVFGALFLQFRRIDKSP